MVVENVEPFVVIDVETTGLAPGVHSLMSLAAVTVERNSNGVWSVTGERHWLAAEPESGWVWSAGGRHFWDRQPEHVRDATLGRTGDRLPLGQIAVELERGLNRLRFPVMAARAVGFEWGWVEHLYASTGVWAENPFKHRGFDLNTAVSMMVPQSIYDRTPGEVWSEDDGSPNALVDARTEAELLTRVLTWRDSRAVN